MRSDPVLVVALELHLGQVMMLTSKKIVLHFHSNVNITSFNQL